MPPVKLLPGHDNGQPENLRVITDGFGGPVRTRYGFVSSYILFERDAAPSLRYEQPPS